MLKSEKVQILVWGQAQFPFGVRAFGPMLLHQNPSQKKFFDSIHIKILFFDNLDKGLIFLKHTI